MPLVKMSSSKLGAKAAIKYEDDDAKHRLNRHHLTEKRSAMYPENTAR